MTESSSLFKNQKSKKSSTGDSSRSFWEILTFKNTKTDHADGGIKASITSVGETPTGEEKGGAGEEKGGGGDSFLGRHVGGYVCFTSALKSLTRIIAGSYQKPAGDNQEAEKIPAGENQEGEKIPVGEKKGGGNDNTDPEHNGKLLKFSVALKKYYAKYFKKGGETPAGKEKGGGGGGDDTAAGDDRKMLKFSVEFTTLYATYFLSLGAFITFIHKETTILMEFLRFVLVFGVLVNAVFLFSFYSLFTQKIVKKARIQYSLNLLVIMIISVVAAGCYGKKDYRVPNIAVYVVEWIVCGFYIYRKLY